MTSPYYSFVGKLQWKCNKFGSTFKKVDASYTSMMCSCCGKIKYNLQLSDRVYSCICGNIMDRDINAARNIAARAVCCSQ